MMGETSHSRIRDCLLAARLEGREMHEIDCSSLSLAIQNVFPHECGCMCGEVWLAPSSGGLIVVLIIITSFYSERSCQLQPMGN